MAGAVGLEPKFKNIHFWRTFQKWLFYAVFWHF